MVLNPFSLLLVRSRAARVYMWVWGWSWFPSESFAITCAPWFPTCAIKRGLQCYTGMPFTIDMVPSRRHLVKSWIGVIMLHCSDLTSKSHDLHQSEKKSCSSLGNWWVCNCSVNHTGEPGQARDWWGWVWTDFHVVSLVQDEILQCKGFSQPHFNVWLLCEW